MPAHSYATAAAGGALLLALTTLTVSMPMGAAASVPAATKSGTSAAAQPTTVDLLQPQNLPIGEPPQAAYLNYPTRFSPIFRPGKAPLSVGSGQAPENLMRVRGGYMVTLSEFTSQGPSAMLVRFIGDDGSRRPLVHVHLSDYVTDAVASGDGRFVAVTVFNTVKRHQERVIVRRVSDDKLVARRTFATPVYVASFNGHRALLTTRKFNVIDGTRPDMVTQWWNLQIGRLQVLDDAGRPARTGPGLGYEAAQPSPGDLTAGQVAVMRGNHNRVVTLPGRSGRAWRTLAHERVQSWSPDDRYVLTKSGHTDSAGWDVFRIRRARDGALVTTFQGSNNLYRNTSWERPSAFVFYAGYDCSDGDCPSIIVVRCTVHGACEQVAPPAGIILTQERQVPPS
jgi:hypothetical protein